jgi:hypothetical protein
MSEILECCWCVLIKIIIIKITSITMAIIMIMNTNNNIIIIIIVDGIHRWRHSSLTAFIVDGIHRWRHSSLRWAITSNHWQQPTRATNSWLPFFKLILIAMHVTKIILKIELEIFKWNVIFVVNYDTVLLLLLSI